MKQEKAIYLYRGEERFPAVGFPLAVENSLQTPQVPLHTHDFVEIVYVAKGKGMHHMQPLPDTMNASSVTEGTAATSYEIVQGDVFVIAPGESHSYTRNAGLEIFNVLFMPELLKDDYPFLQKLPGLFDFFILEPFFRYETGFRYKLHLRAAEQQAVEGCLRAVMHEVQQQQPGFETMARAKLLESLVVLGRAYAVQYDTLATQSDLQGKEQAVVQAMAFMEEHLGDAISLESIANQVYLSPHYFCERFRECTGLSPWEYLTHLRIEQAKHLLRTSPRTITDIAQAVGFNDSSYFARIFKTRTGASPRDYRNAGR